MSGNSCWNSDGAAADCAGTCGVFEAAVVKDEKGAGCDDGAKGASLGRGIKAAECGDVIAFRSICTAKT